MAYGDGLESRSRFLASVGSNPTPPASPEINRNQSNGENKAFAPELIAPCGMNCGICSGYLAYSKKLPKQRGKIIHCTGCRPRNKRCAFIKGHCQKLRENQIHFCFECDEFPCRNLRRIDERYRRNYKMSMIENLSEIKQSGIESFLYRQQEKYQCPRCGGVICVHNGKCYDCDTIQSWRG